MPKDLDLSNFKHIEPIPRQIGDKVIDLADARRVWECLGSRQEFTNWIRRRIETYSFKEGADYWKVLVHHTIRRPRTEYYITLRMGKHLAMIESTPRGMQVRDYYIALEATYQHELALRCQKLELRGKADANERVEIAAQLAEVAESQLINQDLLKSIDSKVTDIREATKKRRKDILDSTKIMHNQVVLTYYQGNCPICKLIRIVDSSCLKLPGCRYHHWRSPSLPHLKDTMAMCEQCHNVFTTSDVVYAMEMLHHFTAYQSYVNICFASAQIDLF